MLTNALTLTDKEIIIDESQPLLFDSGNPFISTQTVMFKKSATKFIPSEDHIDNLEINSAIADKFFNNQVAYSLKSVNKFKSNPYVINNAGLAFLNRGNYEEAEKYFNRAIELQPQFYPSLANLAKLYFHRKEYDKALDVYKTIQTYFPEDVKVLQNISHALLKKGEIDKSLVILLDVVKKDNRNSSAYNNIGVIYILKGNIDKAINALRHALNLNANFANAYNNLGACYAIKKDHIRAIRSYQSAIALNKNFLYAIKNLARSYQEIGEYAKVFDLINKYIDQYSSDADLLNILADSSYLDKKYKQALKILNKLIDIFAITDNAEEKARIHNNIGVVSAYLGERQNAYKHYYESISLHGDPLTYNNLFNAFLRDNKLSEAKNIVTEARILFPNNCDLLVSEGKILHAFKDYVNSCASLKKAIECNRRLTTPYTLLSHIKAEIEHNLTEAINVVREGLKYNPKDVGLNNNLAYFLLQTNTKNSFDEARRLLDQFTSLEDVFLLATRGLLLLKENNVNEAERLYNKAAAIAKNKDLQNRVKQKKLLELGKYFLNKDEKRKAYNYFQKALKIKSKNEVYSDQIRDILSNKF